MLVNAAEIYRRKCRGTTIWWITRPGRTMKRGRGEGRTIYAQSNAGEERILVHAPPYKIYDICGNKQHVLCNPAPAKAETW